MLEKALWQNLKALVDIDKRIFGLDNDINSNKQLIIELDGQIAKQKNALDDRKKLNTSIKKQIDLFELQIKSLENEEIQKKALLDKIKTQREYRSLEHEITHLSREKMSIENQITQLWYKHEETQNNNAADELKLIQMVDQLTSDIESRKEIIEKDTTQKESLVNLRQEATSKIPSDWLVKYERMKHNVTDPIVPIFNDCCSACYYSILRQDLFRIKHAGVLPCRNCYRFLYYNNEEQADLTHSQY